MLHQETLQYIWICGAKNAAGEEKVSLCRLMTSQENGTQMELVWIYLKKCDLSEDLAQNRLKW